jgi:hypothetical protein
MSESAYEWGVRHGSCPAALKWRRSLGPVADARQVGMFEEEDP